MIVIWVQIVQQTEPMNMLLWLVALGFLARYIFILKIFFTDLCNCFQTFVIFDGGVEQYKRGCSRDCEEVSELIYRPSQCCKSSGRAGPDWYGRTVRPGSALKKISPERPGLAWEAYPRIYNTGPRYAINCINYIV